MIKTKKGAVKIKGSLTEIKADLSVIVYNLCFEAFTDITPEKAKEHIMDAVERGFKTPEQLEAEMKKQLGELLGGISKHLKGQGEE